MVFSFPEIFALILQYKYFFLFPVTVLEGPIITVIAGFFVSQGALNFLLTYLVVVTGDLTGDIFFYYLGKYGRLKLIDRWGHYFGANRERVNKLMEQMQKNTAKVMITGKIIEGTGALVQMTAGAAHIKFRQFFILNLIPTLPKSLLYLLLGFYFGQAYVVIAKYLDYASYIAVIAIAIFIVIYILIKKYIIKTVKIDE